MSLLPRRRPKSWRRRRIWTEWRTSSTPPAWFATRSPCSRWFCEWRPMRRCPGSRRISTRRERRQERRGRSSGATEENKARRIVISWFSIFVFFFLSFFLFYFSFTLSHRHPFIFHVYTALAVRSLFKRFFFSFLLLSRWIWINKRLSLNAFEIESEFLSSIIPVLFHVAVSTRITVCTNKSTFRHH